MATVRQIQTALNLLPTRLPRLAVDGQLGSKTSTRIAEFQSLNGMWSNGQLDNNTANRIMAAAYPATANISYHAGQINASVKPPWDIGTGTARANLGTPPNNQSGAQANIYNLPPPGGAPEKQGLFGLTPTELLLIGGALVLVLATRR